MHFILFGAGDCGKVALHFLGYDRIKCFVDNNRFGEIEEGKNIISFQEMLNIIEDEDMIAISSDKYYREMERQLKDHGITKYFIFHAKDQWNIANVLPTMHLCGKWERISYTRCLGDYHINQYTRIAIVGVNPFIHYLLLEIASQNSWDSIVGIIGKENEAVYTFGIPFVKLEDIWDSIDCLVINVKRIDSTIHEIIENRKHTFEIADIYKISQFNYSFYYPELKKYKNIYKGERVFIIGNGPSLKIEDLEILHKHKEICFGFNRIYRVYNRTKWRPNYIGITDIDLLVDCYKDLEMMKSEVFLGDCSIEIRIPKEFSNVKTIHLEIQEYYPNYPDFSDDISKGVYWGYSVTYDIGIQVAAYMGFKEIYLIGMDHAIIGNISDERNHFINNYYKEDEKSKYSERVFEKDKITKAYEKAELYSRTHGFRIYNATRGGELEVFERVNFDSLFLDNGIY